MSPWLNWDGRATFADAIPPYCPVTWTEPYEGPDLTGYGLVDIGPDDILQASRFVWA